MKRTGLLASAALIGGAFLLPGAAQAATCPAGFPSGPIAITVGFGAGAGNDNITRVISAEMERAQGWTVVVDNKPGASGGTMLVNLKSQSTDGHTLGVASTDAVAFNPAQSDVGYTHEDFDYLASAMRYRVGLVALADKPFNDLNELIDYAKEKGRATISVAGVNQELLLRQLNEQYGVNLVPIPGAGSAEAMTSALGGHVDATIQASLHVEQIKSGGMKQLASLIEVRVPYAPDSKTLAEHGATAMPLDLHTIFVAPKGLDPAVKTCLQEALDEAIKSDAYADLMVKIENEAFNLGEAGMIEVIQERFALYKEALAKN